MSNHNRGNHDATRAAALLETFFPTALQPLRLLYALFYAFCDWFAVTLEVFIRRDFGERYFNLVRLYIASWLFGAVTWTGSIFLRGNRWDSLLSFAQFAFLALCVFHYVHIRQRNSRGILWHSRSFGVSHLDGLIPWFDDWTLYRFIEPALFFALGLPVLLLHRALGAWLLIASVAMFIKNNLTYAQERERLLDIIDAKIDAGFTAAALEGKPKQQAGGISRVKLPLPIARELKALASTAASAELDFSDLISVQLQRGAAPVAVPVAEGAEEPDFSDLVGSQLRRPGVAAAPAASPAPSVQVSPPFPADPADTAREKAKRSAITAPLTPPDGSPPFP